MRLLLQESSHHDAVASYAELQSTLISEREHSAELCSLLAAERQTAVNAQQESTVLSERLAETVRQLFLCGILLFSQIVFLSGNRLSCLFCLSNQSVLSAFIGE